MLRGIVVGLLMVCSVASAGERNDLTCLAKNVYHESRGEPTKAMIGVAHVTLTRSKASGDSICDVVYERGQFSWTRRERKMKIVETEVFEKIKALSHDVLSGKLKDPTNGAVFFRTSRSGSGQKHLATLGNIHFFR